MNRTELKTIYDHANSFYKKAYYTVDDANNITLYSYNSKIITITNAGGLEYPKIYGYGGWGGLLSNTTLRHLKEFLAQFCPKYSGMTKSQLLQLHDKTVNG